MSDDMYGRRMAEAIDGTTCEKHNAPLGIPCFHIPKHEAVGEGYYAAICGARIRKHGFIGKISPTAMRDTPPEKRGPTKVKKHFSTSPLLKNAVVTTRSTERSVPRVHKK